MFVDMRIDPADLRKSEEILIGGAEFDDERRFFINYPNTVDLLAAPGSGKTTALLAKLYCIVQQRQFGDKGILVLAHTNHAIEEIERVLKPLCPALFSYPNFVGTVQSFTNKFVANQACFELYGSYIRKNDDEMYLYEVEKFYYGLKYNKTPPALKNKLFGIVNRGLNVSFQEKENNILEFLKSCSFDLETRKIKLGSAVKMTSTGANRDYYLELEQWKIGLLSKGILSYKDSFDISSRYLKDEYSTHLKSILQQRFGLVFIDEMQDLNVDQISIIESIFFSDESATIIQRIGDKNQAIYSSTSLHSETTWQTRHEVDPERFKYDLSLNNSHRLTKVIGDLVDGFVLDRSEGYKVVGSANRPSISPYLLIYNDERDADKLKEKFVALIKHFELDKDSKNLERGYHIIAWTTDKEEGSNKWHLRKLFPEYSRVSKKNKEDFDRLRKYIFLFDRNKKTFEAVRKSILNGIIRILRIEEVFNDVGTRKHFRKSTFIELVKSKGVEFYNAFKIKLYNWCYSVVVEQKYEAVFIEYSNYINNELIHLIPDFRVDKSITFINKEYDFIETEQQVVKTQEDEQINIKLGSIHSVKGQTHCATMYVETEYHTSETSKLKIEVKGTGKRPDFYGKNPLFFQEQNFSALNKVRSNETLKMMYVGFSRPTDLLCFAVRKNNVENDIEKFAESGWNIEYVTD